MLTTLSACKIDADTFEVNTTNYSQDIKKIQFQRHVTAPLHNKLYCAIQMRKKNIFKGETLLAYFSFRQFH